MGMTIEELVAENDKLKRQLAYESTALTMMKADYNARLKDDLVAMLTEIQLEIEEIEIDVPFGFEPISKTSAFYEGISASSKVIQEKINALKEQTGEEIC